MLARVQAGQEHWQVWVASVRSELLEPPPQSKGSCVPATASTFMVSEEKVASTCVELPKLVPAMP